MAHRSAAVTHDPAGTSTVPRVRKMETQRSPLPRPGRAPCDHRINAALAEAEARLMVAVGNVAAVLFWVSLWALTSTYRQEHHQ